MVNAEKVGIGRGGDVKGALNRIVNREGLCWQVIETDRCRVATIRCLSKLIRSNRDRIFTQHIRDIRFRYNNRFKSIDDARTDRKLEIDSCGHSCQSSIDVELVELTNYLNHIDSEELWIFSLPNREAPLDLVVSHEQRIWHIDQIYRHSEAAIRRLDKLIRPESERRLTQSVCDQCIWTLYSFK